MDDFIKSRIPFIFLEGGECLYFESFDRSFAKHAASHPALRGIDYSNLVRGYVTTDRVVFFMAGDYSPVASIPAAYYEKAATIAYNRFHSTEFEIWNGVIPGIEGTVWQPVHRLDSYKLVR